MYFKLRRKRIAILCDIPHPEPVKSQFPPSLVAAGNLTCVKTIGMKLTSVLLLIVVSFCTFAQKKKSTAPKATIAHADSLFAAGKQKEAIATYEAALKDPNVKDARAWFRVGTAYLNAKDYNRSLQALVRAFHMNRTMPGVRIAIVRANSALGNIDETVAQLDSLIITGFGNYKLMDSDPELANLRKDPRYKGLRDRAIAMAYPCLALPEARQFDFWLGSWDVFVTANMSVKAGENKITRASEGCVILENWEASGPHRGMSMNYYDPILRKWQQKWAGSGQDIMEFNEGEYADNIMRFKFTGNNPDGTTFPGRLTFTNMTDSGRVRQHSERTSDGGKTWQTIYDFTYVRKADGETP